MCQIILQLFLIHFVGTVSTIYPSQSLDITEWPPYLTLDWYLIASLFKLLPDSYQYCHTLVCLYIYMRKTTVTLRDRIFSPTEMPHGRHEQVGIGRKWWYGCGTRSEIYTQTIWHNWHPFHNHHPYMWFSVHIFSPPPLKIITGEIWSRMVCRLWSL